MRTHTNSLTHSKENIANTIIIPVSALDLLGHSLPVLAADAELFTSRFEVCRTKKYPDVCLCLRASVRDQESANNPNVCAQVCEVTEMLAELHE